jgi:hypothetical protein
MNHCSALTPALSPKERENHSPRFDEADALGCRVLCEKNGNNAGIGITAFEFLARRQLSSLSSGERVGVRASISHFQFEQA